MKYYIKRTVNNELCTATNLCIHESICPWLQSMDNRKQFKESLISLGYLPHFLKLRLIVHFSWVWLLPAMKSHFRIDVIFSLGWKSQFAFDRMNLNKHVANFVDRNEFHLYLLVMRYTICIVQFPSCFGKKKAKPNLPQSMSL